MQYITIHSLRHKQDGEVPKLRISKNLCLFWREVGMEVTSKNLEYKHKSDSKLGLYLESLQMMKNF